MRVFVDSSVALAACGSSRGASRELFTLALQGRVEIVTAPWCLAEIERNLPGLGPRAQGRWPRLRRRLKVVPTAVVLDRPLVFGATKDRPVLISALASGSRHLLTLDQGDFQTRLGRGAYGLEILTPGEWLAGQIG